MFAFEGVKIVDLTNYIAGGFCCGLLADLGADVIKVETHAGDPFRPGVGFLNWNRSKRAMILDLKQPEGKEVLFKLVERADVVVENYRPGVADRLGIGFEALKKVNPRIIYCAISAWGQDGPYAHKPGFDPLMQAMGGVMANQGGPDAPPVFMRVAVSDYGGAMLGSYGVAAALYIREKTGIAQRVETCLLNAVVAMQASHFLKFEQPPDKQRLNSIPYQLFQTTDHWIFVACGNDNFWAKFCEALDIADFASDPRFINLEARNKNREELLGILQEILLTKTTAEWVHILEEHDVPVGPVRTMDEVFGDPQALHNEAVVDVDHPELGKYWQVGAPLRFSETPVRRPSAAPLLGQHTIEVLDELGYAPEQIEQLKKKRVI